ncbi:EAL domain-containing response regulator [Halomonas sp. TRM85114]|uniref:EAL domain-containing response regulator n=1 Tax=Halomonas jincaotanensis TaxID=2810616 RepID=UPI001BD668AB|nr:EAL domain-containing response regulator [Halomonas jincaotanensis]MBS9403637.1 EAL domain-containing response regulator [Halomonas jincaotanensis]
MHDPLHKTRALVLETDLDVAAELSLQLSVLGMESCHFRQAAAWLENVALYPPPLVIMALEFGEQDGIALLHRLAEANYRGRVLLISGVERKVARIAERVGQTLGLQMLGSLEKPMRLAELRQRLGRWRVVRETLPHPEAEPVVSTHELALALARNELTLYYQPQYELASDRLSGVEALVRWDHPRLGLLGPDSFLPLLTRAQGKRLTRYVLKRALDDAERWCEEGVFLSLSVNVTADDLMNPDLLELTRHATPNSSRLVVLEITESAVMEDELLGSEVAARLHLGGLEMSVDDFGVGFSSLSRLQVLPISEVKIDRSFVSHLHENPQDSAIVEAVSLLGRRLGIRVVAEGIEELSILPLLEQFGCTHVQGFGLSQPVSANAIPALASYQLPIRSRMAESGASLGNMP